MTAKKEHKNKGFWDYCCESPFLAFFLFWILADALVAMVNVIVTNIPSNL